MGEGTGHLGSAPGSAQAPWVTWASPCIALGPCCHLHNGDIGPALAWGTCEDKRIRPVTVMGATGADRQWEAGCMQSQGLGYPPAEILPWDSWTPGSLWLVCTQHPGTRRLALNVSGALGEGLGTQRQSLGPKQGEMLTSQP